MESRGAGFTSSTLPLTGFVLGRPEFNSSGALCKWPSGLPPASWDFQALNVYLKYLFFSLRVVTSLQAYNKLFFVNVQRGKLFNETVGLR